MGKRRGRPASNNPRKHRIETRINEQSSHELQTVCALTGSNKTLALDWAIRIMYLLHSDSRTRDSITALFNYTPHEETCVKTDTERSIFESLSDVITRFPDIDMSHLSFIQDHEMLNSPEETLCEIVDEKYFLLVKKYKKDEIATYEKIKDREVFFDVQ